jgi:hypothetical protein
MSPDKSPQNLFNEALEQPDAAQRARFLDQACGADKALRERVERLLRAHDEAGGFFSQPSKASSSARASDTIVLPVTEKAGDKIGRYKLLQQIPAALAKESGRVGRKPSCPVLFSSPFTS